MADLLELVPRLFKNQPQRRQKIVMIAAIATSDTFLTLLGAGPIQMAFINQLPKDGMIRVAADGGAISWVKAGIIPDVVIGDMDSLDPVLSLIHI